MGRKESDTAESLFTFSLSLGNTSPHGKEHVFLKLRGNAWVWKGLEDLFNVH